LAGRGTPAHRALGREEYKLTRLTQKQRASASPGPFCFLSLLPPYQALHDTYYVVSNTSPFLFLTKLTVIVAAARTAIPRLSKPRLRKSVMAAVATFALGVLLLAPDFVTSIYDPTSNITALIIANRLALIGAAAVALTSLLTLGILIVTGFSALLRNR